MDPRYGGGKVIEFDYVRTDNLIDASLDFIKNLKIYSKIPWPNVADDYSLPQSGTKKGSSSEHFTMKIATE